MGAEQQELVFKVVVDAQTGQLKGVAQGFKDLKAPAEEAGEHASNAMGKIEHHVTRMAMSMFLGALALEGFKKLAEESGPFQALQGTIEGVIEKILTGLNPAIGTISTGLQAVTIMIGGIIGLILPAISTAMDIVKAQLDALTAVVGATLNIAQGNFRGAWESIKQGGKDAVGEFKTLGTEWKDGWQGMVKAAEEAVGRTTGANSQMTKIMAAHLDTLLTSENAHVQAMAKLRESDLKFQMGKIGETIAQKLVLVKEGAKVELAAINAEENTKLQILKAKRDSLQLTEMQYNDQIAVIKKASADQRLAVDRKEAQEEETLQREHVQKMTQIYEADLNSFATAAGQKIAESHNLGEALKAGGQAMIKTMTDQAVKEITVLGAKAAANAYYDTYKQSGGGYYGIAAGAAAAAGVFAEYGAIAAVVGGVGYSLASSAGGGSSSSGSSAPSTNSGSSGNGPAATAQTTSTASPAPLPQGGPSTGQSAPAGAGQGQLVMNIYLDGHGFAKFIYEGTRDGYIQVSQKGIVP